MAAGDGDLLDNNVISVLARPTDPRYASIEGHLKALGGAPIMLPVIAIAEIEFGMAKATNPDPAQPAQLRAFFNQYPLHLGFDDNTVEPYTQLRAEIWRLHATPRKRGHKERLVGKAVDRYTLLVGGTLLGNRLAEVYRDMVPANEIVHELTRVFTVYKQQRRMGESLGDFCNRIGIEMLQANCTDSVF